MAERPLCNDERWVVGEAVKGDSHTGAHPMAIDRRSRKHGRQYFRLFAIPYTRSSGE